MSKSEFRVMDWKPDAGETVLCRSRISYATGAAPAVAGYRWFRNTEREDIQGELPGWPEGPVYAPHSAPGQSARRTGRFAGIALPALLNAAVGLFGGSGSPFGDPEILGEPAEPENEVHDFPVMWAAPDAIARSFPWQLDPARRPKDHTSHAVITDLRLVLLHQGPRDDTAPDVLRSVPRRLIGGVEAMEFSHGRADTRIRFTDGSWVRVVLTDPTAFRHLVAPPVLLREDQLTSAQRAALADFVAKWPPCDEPPLITRRADGDILVELRVPGASIHYGYLTQHQIIPDSRRP